MRKAAIATALGMAAMFPMMSAPPPALAAADMMTSVPAGKTIKDYYDQSVYDPSNNKIGSIDDVLVSDSGQITAFMIGVGGFLGAGTKDVAVPFHAVRAQMKDGSWYLTIDTTKDQLKSAPGYTHEKDKWVPAKNS
ncbi:MAG TPA: PRC-barrel domain-containing protein [Acetobacteraceae bacterium]|nr:PRC-barrel domain-containing protein [Acetobacteraceae bacterium]